MDAGKKSFLWLVAVFVAPIVLGTLLFFNLENLGIEKGSVNYGTLIDPAFPVKGIDLKQGSEPVVYEDTLAKKWTLLYIETTECNEFCLNRLLLMKRIRLLTNENMRRVRTLFVSNQKILDAVDKEQNKDLVIASIELNNSKFMKQFPDLDQSPVYLIDPFGNLMMYYPQADPDAKKMLKDLHRLLKYSHLG